MQFISKGPPRAQAHPSTIPYLFVVFWIVTQTIWALLQSVSHLTLACDAIDVLPGSLRRFQVQQYLKVSNFGDPKFWNMGTAEYKLSFESIRSLSPRELDRGQRSQLANRVLRVLLRANISSLATMQNQLVVLTKLITIPNKSMEILTNVRESVPEESKEAAGEPILMALARKIDGSMEWSDDNIHCVKTLRRLVRSVLRSEKSRRKDTYSQD